MEPFPRALPSLPGKETFEDVSLSVMRKKHRGVTRKQTSGSGTDELPDAQLDNDGDYLPDKHTSRKKRTQKKKNKPKHSPLPDDLSVEEEDVLSTPPLVEASGVENRAPVCSQPSGVFFVESKGGFRVSEKPWEYCQKGLEPVEEQVMQSTTQDVARRAQEAFWANLARPLPFLRHLLTFDPSSWASLAYLSALIVSLGLTMTSDKIALHLISTSQGIDPSHSLSEMEWLKSWLAARITICILCALAWLELAWSPVPDCTFETLF
uniref:Uncharacterized protein n=1 Tax=Eptatretus burgeri TaxID=7764 RepID=A0A8C4QJR4_EPTBU